MTRAVIAGAGVIGLASAHRMAGHGLPVVGPLPGRDNVLVAGGHPMNGGTDVRALPDAVRPFRPARSVARYRRPGARTT